MSLGAAARKAILEANWLNRERLAAYSRIVLALYAVAIVGWLAISRNGVDPAGKPIGYDFMVFWSAARLAGAGEPAAVYEMARLREIQLQALPEAVSRYAWPYPPTFLLVVLPLGALPYFAALVTWLAATLTPLVLLLRRIVPHPLGPWLLAAFPGCFQNLMQGQNGFLSAALLGGGLHFLDRRPWLSGLLFGLLTYKPHLGLLVPLVLLVTRRWQVFLAASLTTVGFAALSLAAFGSETWWAFLAHRNLILELLDQGLIPWSKMPTLFAALRLLGMPTSLAATAQAMLALIVAAMTILAWRGRARLEVKAAILVVGSLLVSPYSFDYDLVLLVLPVAWLGWLGYREGFLPGEKFMLFVVALLPMLATAIASQTGLQLGWLVLALFFLLLWRRQQAEIQGKLRLPMEGPTVGNEAR